MIRRLLASCLALVAVAGLVRGDPAQPKPKRLVLTPAAAPVPALKFTLLPRLREQQPGNAAPLYRKAGETLKARLPLLNDPMLDQAYRWAAMRPEKLRLELKEALDYVQLLAPAFDDIEAATRSTSCDWNLLEEFRKPDFDFNQSQRDGERIRTFAVFLQLRNKVSLADDRPEDALRDVRTLLTAAWHLNKAPTLVHSLYAAAFTLSSMAMLEATLQHPKAPNLYWALADLPRPFIDLRLPLQGERELFFASFPGLAAAAANPDAGPMPADKVAQYGKKLMEMDFFGGQFDQFRFRSALLEIPGVRKASALSKPTLDKIQLGQAVKNRHEGAKQTLVEWGRPREKVEQMPPIQVALLHLALEQDLVLDELLKMQQLPYWQAAPAIKELSKKMSASHSLLAQGPAFSSTYLFLMPGMTRAAYARARVDRQLAALRCVEAIRLHAAANAGKLPSSLDEIKEVLIPSDPMTGKAFQYRREGDKALLWATPTAEDTYLPLVPRYELTLAPTK